MEAILEHIPQFSFVFMLGVCVGSGLTLFATKRNLTLAQYIAVMFLLFYMVIILVSTVTGFEIEIFLHAGGLASLGTLIGIETSEFFSFVKKKK